MNAFELQQELQKEYGDFNLITVGKSVYVQTFIGRSCISEVVNRKRIVYDSVDSLLKKSSQLEKYKNMTTLKAEVAGSDAKNWKVSRL